LAVAILKAKLLVWFIVIRCQLSAVSFQKEH